MTVMTVQPLDFDLAAALARQPRRRLIAMAEAAGGARARHCLSENRGQIRRRVG